MREKENGNREGGESATIQVIEILERIYKNYTLKESEEASRRYIILRRLGASLRIA